MLSCARLQPGRLAVGPDEKQGLLGFRSGLVIQMSVHVLIWRSIRDGPASVLEPGAIDEDRLIERFSSPLNCPARPAPLLVVDSKVECIFDLQGTVGLASKDVV